MRTLFLLAAVILGSPVSSIAQAVAVSQPNAVQDAQSDEAITAEALTAIVREDYKRAADLLNPLMNNWARESSPAAALFLGFLYEYGLGVPQDNVRACALYSKAEATTSLLNQLAMRLRGFQIEILGPFGAGQCNLVANLGIDHRFTPASFTFDANHSVSIELANSQDVVATITYRGQERQVNIGVPMGFGTVFLPFQTSTLVMPDGTRRHFIEAAAWLASPEAKWTLVWSLTEVSEDDAVSVANAELTTFDGASPRDVSVDLREFVTLHVNQLGHAEYAVVKGLDPTEAAIPDRKERQEVANERARRRTFEDSVDWNLQGDPARAPSFRFVDAEGCGNVQLFAWSADKTEAIVAYVNRELLELSASPRTIDLVTPREGIKVYADVYERPQRERYCTDVLNPEVGRKETWQVVGGILTIQVSPRGIRAGDPLRYRATIQIDDAVFRNASGRIVRPSAPIRLTGMAGLFAG